jgi:hypothetical protein
MLGMRKEMESGHVIISSKYGPLHKIHPAKLRNPMLFEDFSLPSKDFAGGFDV